MRTVVILPTYNERESILPLLEMLSGVTHRIKNHSFSFLVVDDTSPDGTSDLVHEYMEKYKNVHIISGKKQGLGKALLRGMTYAVEKMSAEIIVQMDADLSHDPNVLPLMMAEIDRGADYVVGSRYIPNGSIPDNWAPHRQLFSIVGNAIVRFGLGFPSIHDWTGGYRVYSKKYYLLARDEMVKYSGYVFQIAFLHKSVVRGAKVAEVPIHFTDRKFGHSKIAPSQYIRDVLRYVARERFQGLLSGPFLKFCVVGGIGFIINTVVLELMVYWKFHPTVGSAVGAELAIISNFFLNNIWTFGSKRIYGTRLIGKFIQFNGTSAGAIILQAGTVAVGSFLFGVAGYHIYYIFGVGLGLVWNYIMYSRVIWKK